MSYPAEPENPLTKKLGPLPVWGWASIGLLLALFLYLRNKNSSSNSSNNVPAGTTDSSLVPQFVNQTYTQVTPPNVTVNSTPAPVTVNNNPPATPGSTPKPPPGGFNGNPPSAPSSGTKVFPAQKYTVKKGDTLLSLSKEFLGTSNRTALAHANGLGTGAGLKVGQVITIPAHTGMANGTPQASSDT